MLRKFEMPGSINKHLKISRTLHNKISAVFFYLINLLGAICIVVPWSSKMEYADLEMSWGIALHYLFQHGVLFGKDVVFTFGPYGFVYTRQYFPQTYTVMFLLYCFLAILYAGTLWFLFNQRKFPTPIIFLCSNSLLIVLCSGIVFNYTDAFFYMVPAFFLLLHFLFPDYPKFLKFWLVLALALVCQIKNSFTLVVLFVVFVGSIDTVFCKKKLPGFLIIFLFGFLFFWFMAGQAVTNICTYWLNNIVEVSDGYSVAMAIQGESISIYFFTILSIVLIQFLFVFPRPSQLLSKGLFLGGVLFLIFTVFKASFVRHDAHQVIGFTFLPSFFVLLILLNENFHKKRWLLYPIAFLFLFVGTGLDYLESNVGGIINWASNKNWLEDQYKIIQKENRMDIQGAVDAYPYLQGLLIIGGIRYVPRPILQSYAAYSAELARMNAERLKTSDAPDTILFRIGTIDGRYPPFDDGLSWPEIWTRYRFDSIDKNNDSLILKRKEEAGKYFFSPLLSTTAKFGEGIKVPGNENDLIWAKIFINESLLGKIVKILYKLYPPEIEIILQNGNTERYRLLPQVAISGILLSPIVKDKTLFREILELNAANGKGSVFSFKILPSSNELFFERNIRVDFYKLKIEK